MQTNHRTHYEDRSGERGVALLLTLGIVSLLLMLALSFALTARMDRQAASVTADTIKARLLAESGLERALGYLYYGAEGELYPGTGDLFVPANNTPALLWFFHRYMFSAGTADDQDASGKPPYLERAMSINLDFNYNPDGIPNGASWHHVEDDDDLLIGRIAFIVVDESGKIDPNAAVNFHEPFIDDNLNGTRDSGEPFNDCDGTGSYNSSAFDEGPEKLWGFCASEINLGNAYPASVDTTDILPTRFRTQMHSNADRWFSWYHMFNRIDGMTGSRAQDLSKVFFPYSYDSETYWDGENPQNRFNLRQGIDWDNTTVMAVRNAIPWIVNMVDSAGNSVANQVAANLIDYSSSNSSTTNDFDDSTLTATYVGLVKTPYINEVLFALNLDSSDPDDPILNIVVRVELANIYPEDLNGHTVRVDFDIDADEFAPESHSIFLTANTGSDNTVPANSYLVYDNAAPQAISGLSAPSLINCTVSNIKVFMYNGTLDSANLKDYAEVGETTFSGPAAFTFEVIDPRHNLPSSQWDHRPGAGTEGGANTNANPRTAGGDTETATDPVTGMSTAYIRNAPMQSLWELGAIHRGETYRTINLTAFNDGEDLAAQPANYDNGDAAILDQVRIGPQIRVYGRVNANSPIPGVWAGLIGQAYIGADYENNAGGSQILDAERTAIAAAIADYVANNPSANRGHVAAVAAMSNGAGQINQREQEQIIGTIASLLTTRQNFFRVAVTAQAVQDLGASPPGAVQGERNVVDAGDVWCRILAEQKIMAIVYRDAFNNTYRILRYEYLED